MPPKLTKRRDHFEELPLRVHALVREMLPVIFPHDRLQIGGRLFVVNDAQQRHEDLVHPRLRATFDAFQKENDTFWSEHEKVRQEILKELTPRQQIAYLIWESESPRKTGRVLRALRKMGELRQPPKPEPEARAPKRNEDTKTPPETR